MGKMKKLTPKKTDNKQAKISNFFQAASTNTAVKATCEKQSVLFTSVNRCGKAKPVLAFNARSAATTSTAKNKSSAVKPTTIVKDDSNKMLRGQFEKPKGTEVGKGKSVLGGTGYDAEKNIAAQTSGLSMAGTGTSSSPIDVDSVNNSEGANEAQRIKSVLFQASEIIKIITGGNTGVSSTKEVSDDGVTCVPETQLDLSFSSPPRVVTEYEQRMAAEPQSDSENECSMIPDTPQPEKNNVASKKKKAFRSFLSCNNNLQTNNTLHHKLKQAGGGKLRAPVAKLQKTKTSTGPRSLEDALKSVENDLEFASPESFNAMLTGVGFGKGPVIPKGPSSHCSDSRSKLKPHTGTVGCLSGVKRSSMPGSSPNAKRTMIKTPTKSNSSIINPHQPNTENYDTTKSAKVRKFSRNLSQTSFNKNLLVKRDNFPRDATEKNMNLGADDDLCELLQQYQSVQPTVDHNPALQQQARVSREALTSPPSPIIPSHDEPDEALDDIISELRDTLTQSNSKRNRLKSGFEGSILSEEVSAHADRGAKRCILIDKQMTGIKPRKTLGGKKPHKGGNNADSVCDGVNRLDEGKSHIDLVKESSRMDVDDEESILDQSEIICGAPNDEGKAAGLASRGSMMAPKPEAVCADLDVSDLQFDETDLELGEDLRKEFDLLSPFKQEKPKSGQSLAQPEADAPCIQFGRCQVQAVLRDGADVHLELLTEPGGQRRQALLTGFWSDAVVAQGDIVHVVGDFDESGHIRVSDRENLLVVHPDLLISGTSVVGGIYCMRRAVLNERFKGYDNKSIHMLYGTIIHAFFQQVVQKGNFTPEALETVMTSVLQQSRILHDMYGQGVPAESVMEEIQKYVPQLQAWAAKYLASTGHNKPVGELSISRVVDIEENIWSPRYGIKGKIDLTVEVKIHDRTRGTQTKLMPLELKTGRPSHSIEHKGQVTLYSMMSGDRRADPGAGLLLYLKDGSMSTVPADHAHKAGLVQLRNELAHHVVRSIAETEGSGMPRPINSARSCTKCPHLINCAIYQKVLGEPAVEEGHTMARLVPETLEHLSDQHLEFYRHWVRLMMLELSAEGTKGTAVSDLWCKTGWQREVNGLCLSGMVLVRDMERSVMTETGHFRQTFTRVQAHPSAVRLIDVGIVVRDNLVVSAENEPLIALTMGGVSAVTDKTVTLMLDRDLSAVDHSGRLVYRLDKADTFNTMATNMTNLARLMERTDTSTRLREIVIEKKTPEFETTMSKGVIEQVKGIFKQLNKPQKKAILKVLMCEDYVLIKGYPGTGKTSTIVNLVRILTLLGRSVLLTSYTHSAVDNILLKLIKHGVDFARLGRVERIHPNVRLYSTELKSLNIKSVDELSQFYESKSVVATTCLGVGSHPVFSRRTFDLCIVDEASQVLQPACLGPLFASRRFVLVGDPLQLPPVVQSHKARDAGMAESLFARLDDTGGTYELNMQYRMNADIMRLSNELVYSGALQCGSEAVARGRLVFPDDTALRSAPEWLRNTFDPDARIMFLDTSKIPVCEDGDKASGVENHTEAELVRRMVDIYVQGGLPREDVGVITPFRAQVSLVDGLLQRHDLGGVEVNTVDQYQGRDKNCIIVSFVKRAPSKGGGGILEDLRRLNVALTRARHKLILVGHAVAFSSYAPLRAVLDILHPHQILQLTPDDVMTSPHQ